MYSELIGRGMTLAEDEVQRLVQAGVMHDIGKLGVRYDMLNKPGKLTADPMLGLYDAVIAGKPSNLISGGVE